MRERVRFNQKGSDIWSLIVNIKVNEGALVKVVKQAKLLTTLYAILEALSQAIVSKASRLSQLQRSIIIHIRDIHFPKISGGLQHRLTKDKEQNRRHGGTLRHSRKEGLRRLSFTVKGEAERARREERRDHRDQITREASLAHNLNKVARVSIVEGARDIIGKK